MDDSIIKMSLNSESSLDFQFHRDGRVDVEIAALDGRFRRIG